MSKNLFEIVNMKTTENPFIKKRRQICDLTTHKKAIANICIKYVGNKKLGSSIFINDEAFYEAIANADESIKKEILKVLGQSEIENQVEEKTKIIQEKVIEPIIEKVKEVVEKVRPIKQKVEKVIKEVKEYELSDDDKELLEYNNALIKSKNYTTRYWNKLTKLADKLKIDYTEIELKDFKALRSLFDAPKE